jgi:hypothetical protein
LLLLGYWHGAFNQSWHYFGRLLMNMTHDQT